MAAVIAVICICLAVVIWDSNRFVTVTYEIRSDKITKPCRFVLLADLHNKSFGKENKRLLAAIEETAPDGILVAGDMLTAIRGADYGNALSLMESLPPDTGFITAWGTTSTAWGFIPMIIRGCMRDICPG